MSRHWIRITTLLCVLATFATLVQSQNAPENSSGMTVIEARRALGKSLHVMLRGGVSSSGWTGRLSSCVGEGLFSLEPLRDIKINSDGFQFLNKGETVSGLIPITEPFENTQEFRFGPMDYVSIKKCKGQFGIIWAGTKDWVQHGIATWEKASDAQLFVEAVNKLVFEYGGGDRAKEAAEFEVFKASARSWRELAVKPELPEETRREKVLAEEALREQDLEAAIAHYLAGLKLTPLWPQGHFNVALLAAEFGDYFDAVRHMRRYVELVPEAPDAQAARDKSIIWEDKAGRRKQRAPFVPPIAALKN
jgi:hypothetical protein